MCIIASHKAYLEPYFMTAGRPVQIPLLFRCRTPKIRLPRGTPVEAQAYSVQAIFAETRGHSACRFGFFPDGSGIRVHAEPPFRAGSIAAINPPRSFAGGEHRMGNAA